ncbi:MAG: ImcF-related family protein [Acidobacteriota bacterium]|nr:ImcF-related family protein [Acidobacteriota bacterium]
MNTKLKYWIAAVALIAWLFLAWFIGSWMHLQGSSLWILRGALALIGVAAFIIVIWLFRVKDKERAAMVPTGVGGDEIDILVREAEMRLQASQLGHGARIGTLPLYLILGEAGSAKTSVVLHSGLEPELLAGQTVQDRVPVPTRTANLWYSRQFIFAEAGSSLLQDPPKWAKLIKKLAPRQLGSVFGKGTPCPRAALVCVDCEAFMKPGASDALAASSERIRTRLREVSQLLGISIPVYVLFTRADRLQFFHDYVRNLTNDEATVVFGATLPMVAYSTGVYAEQETARVSSEFDNLFESLADRRVNLLSQEFDAAKLATTYEFPREFRKLRTLLVQLLVDVCRPSQLRTGPFLRGFYFSGVRPITITTAGPALVREEAAAQPFAASGDAGATSIFDMKKVRALAAQQAQAPAGGESRRVPQWVFLPHLFDEVLLKDTSSLNASASSTKTSLWRRILLATATALLLILIIGFMVSFVRNKNLESQVVTAAQGISDVQLTGQQLATTDMLSKLETLRQSVETLSDYQQNGPPFSMRWGLYVGNSIYPNARRIYFQQFQHLLFGQAQASLVQTLSSLPSAPGSSDQYGPPYDTLKGYLITTSNHDKSTSLFLSPVLMKAWAAGRDIDQDRVQLAQKQFDFYSEQLKIQNPYSSENDTLVISRARNYLSQFSGVERVYRFVLAEAEKVNPSINFNKKFPGSAEVVVDRTEVSGAFTKSGWAFMQNALQNLPKYFSGEQWVLGQETSSNIDLSKLATDLRSRYQQDYIQQWRAFLRGGGVVGYGGLADAAQKLLKLSGNQSPLLALFCVTAQNTALDQPDVVKAFQPVQAVVSPNCQDQYIGGPNQPYVAGLSGLQGCLDRANTTPGDKDAAKAQCQNDAQTAKQAANQIAQGFKIDQEGHVDQTVQNLLLAPITAITGVLKPGPVGGEGLCAQMGPLESKFPFSPPATQEAVPADLALIFDPNTGALSSFYNLKLKNLLLPQGSGYIVNPSATQAVNPAFLSFFNRASGVQRALYSGAPGQIQFKYALRPHPTESVSSVSMNIDGQALNYSGGNSSYQQFTWPGVTGQGVTLTVRIAGGSELTWPSYNGTWGVFHFFADADKTVQNGSVYNVEWVLRVAGGRPVTAPNGKPVTVQFDLDTLGAPPILQKGFFSSLRCVSTVAR